MTGAHANQVMYPAASSIRMSMHAEMRDNTTCRIEYVQVCHVVKTWGSKILWETSTVLVPKGGNTGNGGNEWG
jgi:hypothetical protein